MAPNPPNMTMTPFTEEMENELLERENELNAGRGVEDTGGADAGNEPNQGRVDPEIIDRPKPVQASPQDIKRAAIAARFKADGNDQTKDSPFDGDLTRQENLYGAAAQEQLEPESTGEGDALVGDVRPAPQPAAKRKLNIRGTIVEMTDDEIVAAAQKTLAGDSYLEDARKILDEAKTIKAERTGRDPQHPEGRSSTQDDGLEPNANRTQQPEDDLEKLVEELQFGSDRKETAKQLQGVIQKVASKIADEGHQNRLFNNDLARSQKALADFKAANPDLDNDPIVEIAISQEMMKLYREDIVKLGVVDEAQIPSDPRTLANWHRYYKVNGHTVRSTPDLLEKAKENFVAWRGASPKPAPQPRREQPAPRVQVNVDRDTRRQAIPLQPSRATAPRRDAVVIPQKQTDSDVVKSMRRARGQPVAT